MAAVIARATRLVAALLLAAGCSPLADDEYFGEPLASFEGEIARVASKLPSEHPAVVSIFWAKNLEEYSPQATLVRQASAQVTVGFPVQFTLNLFHPPDDTQRPEGRAWAAAYILAYQDRNGDGAVSQDEIIGGANDALLVWAERSLSATESPTRAPIPAGYSLARNWLNCNNTPPRRGDGGADCGTPLGAPCESDVDCGSGLCRTDMKGGYCHLPKAQGCTPWDSVEHFCSDENNDKCFVKACAQGSDCRESEGYACISGLCTPDVPVAIIVAEEFGPPLLCE